MSTVPTGTPVAVQAADPLASAPSRSWAPGRGVLSGGVAGFLSALIVVILHHLGLDVPIECQVFLPPIVGTFISYVVPPRVQDVLNRLNDQIVVLAAVTPDVPVTEGTVVVPQPKAIGDKSPP